MSDVPHAPAAALGLQLYTLRDRLAGADARAVLAAVAEAGYTHLEPMSVAQLVALAPLAADLGLGVTSCHYAWTAVTGAHELLRGLDPAAVPTRSFAEMVDLAAGAGVRYLVFPYLLPPERAAPDDYRRLADQLNRAAERVAAAGLQHVYHHHSFEFAPLDAAGTTAWDILTERLDQLLTRLELDVFWAAVAGLDPAAFIASQAHWLELLHLKDAPAGHVTTFDEHAVPHEQYLAVGQGSLDFASLVRAARGAGVATWIVEQDYSLDPLRDVALSASHFLEVFGALGDEA